MWCMFSGSDICFRLECSLPHYRETPFCIYTHSPFLFLPPPHSLWKIHPHSSAIHDTWSIPPSPPLPPKEHTMTWHSPNHPPVKSCFLILKTIFSPVLFKKKKKKKNPFVHPTFNFVSHDLSTWEEGKFFFFLIKTKIVFYKATYIYTKNKLFSF